MTLASNIGAVFDLDKASGKLQPSEAFPDYTEFIPSPEVKEEIERYLSDEIARADKDHETIFQEARENIETYKAIKITTDDGQTILPSPLARIAADQVISSTYNKLLMPRPLLSISPYFPNEYDVMVPVEFPDGQGGTATAAIPVKRDADKIAQTWELAYEYILRERINIARKANQIITDAVTSGQGAPACWLKVCYYNEYRQQLQPFVKDGISVDLSDKREINMPVGDPIHWNVLPIFSVVRPLDEQDIQASPWLAERNPKSTQDFLLCYYSGEYGLIEDEETARKLAQLVSDFSASPSSQTAQTNQKGAASNPRMLCDVREVWLNWDVRLPKQPGVKGRTIKRLSLLCQFHVGAGKLLCAYRNPRDDQYRPYVPFVQIEDPHTLSGSNTVGVVKWHQRVKTQLVGNELQNAASANNVSWFADPDTEAYEHLSAARTLRVNEVVPKREDEYVEKWRKGEAHYSLLPVIQYVDQDGMRAANVSAYETGQEIPGRTPAATVSQILASGAMQPITFLRSVAEHLAEAIKLDLRTRRQYYPTGETLHVKDPETQQILEVLFQFPVEDVIDNFRFAFTAADEELAREHELPQLMSLQNLNQQRSSFIAQVVGPMANPQLLPAQRDLLMRMVESDQAIFDRIVTLSRSDSKKFDYTEAVKAIADQVNQAVMQAQTNSQQGAPNANAQPGGGIPGQPTAPTGGGPAVPQQPGPATSPNGP